MLKGGGGVEPDNFTLSRSVLVSLIFVVDVISN